MFSYSTSFVVIEHPGYTETELWINTEPDGSVRFTLEEFGFSIPSDKVRVLAKALSAVSKLNESETE